MMLDRNKSGRINPAVMGRGRYSVHLAIVLSVVFSLTAVAILSKKQLANQLWADVAACLFPMPIALYFRNRIVLLGLCTYVGALTGALLAAFLFGI
jgi:hypothetical protein